MGFLNEIISKYPDAISFGPGAPHPESYTDLDIFGAAEKYQNYLHQEGGLSQDAARRSIFQYGSSQGQICDLVAKALERDLSIPISARSVIITVGCQEAMLLILRSLRTAATDVIAVVAPCYVGIVGAAHLVDFEIIVINEGETGIDLFDLQSKIAALRTSGKKLRALYVAPDFANPSGLLMDLRSREALLNLANVENFLIIEDSAYSFTLPDHLNLPSLKSLDRSKRVIYIGTFSKICLPGVRVGFALADQHIQTPLGNRLLSQELASLKNMVSVNTSPICQAIVGGLLLSSGCSLKVLARKNASLYQHNLNHLLSALDRHMKRALGIRWNRPEGGFFVRMRLPIPVDGSLAEISARDYGVIWTPMNHFFPSPTVSHELRLSCSYLNPAEIDEGARRLSGFLQHIVDPPSDSSSLARLNARRTEPADPAKFD